MVECVKNFLYTSEFCNKVVGILVILRKCDLWLLCHQYYVKSPKKELINRKPPNKNVKAFNIYIYKKLNYNQVGSKRN